MKRQSWKEDTVRQKVWERLRNMKDGLLAVNEYQGLKLPPAINNYKTVQTTWNKCFQTFTIGSKTLNPERGETNTVSHAIASAFIKESVSRLAQKGGLQKEPSRHADLRTSLEFKEAKMARICRAEKKLQKICLWVFLRTPIFTCTKWNPEAKQSSVKKTIPKKPNNSQRSQRVRITQYLIYTYEWRAHK